MEANHAGMRRVSFALMILAVAVGARAGLAAPELRLEVFPGSGASGEAESQTAVSGPISGSATNSDNEFTSSGLVSVDYGVVEAETSTVVGASQQGSLFCPFAPLAHCSHAHGSWTDTLTITARGVANGTVGSFTAQITTSGALSAVIPPDFISFALIFSQYRVDVFVNDVFRERVEVMCSASFSEECLFSLNQRYVPEGGGDVRTIPSAPFGSFDLGPYDFVYGQPFDLEVRLETRADVHKQANMVGVASANADLADTVSWSGVVTLFDGTAGTGNSVALDDAQASAASGVAWVGLPEPAAVLQWAASLLTLSALRRLSRSLLLENERLHFARDA